MATIQCQVSWDAKSSTVKKTYHVVSIDDTDQIQLATTDSQPFVLKCSAPLAQTLNLRKAENTDGLSNLYLVGRASKPDGQPVSQKTTQVECGTLAADGHFEKWGSGFGVDK